MKLKNLLFGLFAGAMIVSSCTTSLTSTSATLKTEKDSVDFYLGYLIGTNFTNEAFADPNMKIVLAGINSAIEKKDVGTDLQGMDNYLREYMMKMQEIIAEKNKAKGEEFLAKNLKKNGVEELSGGIQYKVEKQGDGEKPTESDKVKVHYRGTLIDGTEFDSSYKRDEPAEFFLNQVIRGWTIALQEMPVGSKWTIYIPSDMGYGPRGSGQLIGPNSVLIFEVELLDIVKENK